MGNVYPIKRYKTVAQLNESNISKLFVDKNFSLELPQTLNKNQIVWKRPHEICSAPKFVVDDFHIYDVAQGNLGSCWLLSPIISLLRHKEYLLKIFDPLQTFDTKKYVGKFFFKFYSIERSKWEFVEIDDRIPVFKDSNIPVFCKNNTDSNEFWMCLIEKAFAKFLYGSYKKMDDGGDPIKACFYLLGPFAKFVEIEKNIVNSKDLKLHLSNFFVNKICIATAAHVNNIREGILSNQLISNHAYSILAYDDTRELLKIKNPWGNTYELTSQICIYDYSLNKNDGIFWVTVQDFCKYFNLLDFVFINKTNTSRSCEFNEKTLNTKSYLTQRHCYLFEIGRMEKNKKAYHFKFCFNNSTSEYSMILLTLKDVNFFNQNLNYTVYKEDNNNDKRTVLRTVGRGEHCCFVKSMAVFCNLETGGRYIFEVEFLPDLEQEYDVKFEIFY